MNASASRHHVAGVVGSGALSMSPEGRLRTMSDPHSSLVTVTTSDSTVYDPPLRGVWVGTTGNIAVVGLDDAAAVTISSVASGTYLPVEVSKIMSTNTTASNIIGLR